MTWLTLWHTALPLVAGLLCGRHLRHRRLARAWTAGLHFGLRAGSHMHDVVDEAWDQLDAAAEQTRPDLAYPRWWN
jgi:hypothetical protein